MLFLSGEKNRTELNVVNDPYGVFVKDGRKIKSLLPVGHEVSVAYDGFDIDQFRSVVADAMAKPRSGG